MRVCRQRLGVTVAAMMVLVGFGLAVASTPSQAQAIHLSRQTLQAQVEKAFPKNRRGVELSQPELQLEGAREVLQLCGQWLHMATQAAGTFCAESRLQWNKEPATVSLAAVQLRSLALADGRQLPQPLLQALNLAMPLLVDGTVVYTASGFVGWAVKDLRVQQDRLRIEF